MTNVHATPPVFEMIAQLRLLLDLPKQEPAPKVEETVPLTVDELLQGVRLSLKRRRQEETDAELPASPPPTKRVRAFTPAAVDCEGCREGYASQRDHSCLEMHLDERTRHLARYPVPDAEHVPKTPPTPYLVIDDFGDEY